MALGVHRYQLFTQRILPVCTADATVQSTLFCGLNLYERKIYHQEALADEQESVQVVITNKKLVVQPRRAKMEETGRANSNIGGTQSKYSAEHNKMFELQEIVDELEKRHSKKYTIEQLRAWGNMMMMKKHDSYDRPPDKPFFKQQPATAIRSLGRRIHYRSECMDQLDKWHSLLQCGVITQEQYTEMQESILSDIKKIKQLTKTDFQ